MLQRHYAPRTPLVIAGTNPVETAPRRVGLLRISGDTMEEGYAVVEVLSSKRDLREAAANLFAALRRLDTLGLDRIVAELAPEHGLGLAINDRLRRASAAG
jgi:L-threonylcarbamoyladenylate synthase